MKVYLPRHLEVVAARSGTLQPVSLACASRGTILLVDDDADVGRVTAAFLRKAGFDVTTVAGGNAALASLGSGPVFDAVVTDYAMPGMNGADLVMQARELHPGLPALVITGYAGSEGLKSLPSDVTILCKPFQRKDLVHNVEAMIGGPAHALPPDVAAAHGSEEEVH